jgi:hypothetical protein
VKWVTRARPETDGIACSWLIRQFIDPIAEILYVPADRVLAVAECQGARSFDAPGAEFAHQGNRCTFEVMIERFQLGDDPALARLARIVHAADVAADLGGDPLAAGLAAIAEAGPDVEANDDWLVERGMFVYDSLYAWCRRQEGPEHRPGPLG